MMAPLAIRPEVGTPLVMVSALPGGAEAGDGDRALGHGVDLAVGAQQRGHQQGAAQQALGIAQGGDVDVDARALAGEGRQVGGDHDRGDVVGVQVGVAGVDAQALQHADQALAGEDRAAQVVAGAVQADHQAVAHQQVVAHALATSLTRDWLWARAAVLAKPRPSASSRAGRAFSRAPRRGRSGWRAAVWKRTLGIDAFPMGFDSRPSMRIACQVHPRREMAEMAGFRASRGPGWRTGFGGAAKNGLWGWENSAAFSEV